jgi:Uncharacterized protein conserved in bacteria (DUF2252)
MPVGCGLSSARRARALMLIFCAAMCAIWAARGSAQTTPVDVPFGDRATFRFDKATLRARGASPGLLDKVGSSALRYFRLLARQFSARTCFEFRDLRWRLPSVAVHGDAHLEQFVVTNETFGLEDFDQAGFGPAVVDLVRYAASLHLACRDASWPCNPDQAVSAYFDAYRAALDHPVTRTQPALVNRVRVRSTQDRQAWYRWADSLMQPLTHADDQSLRQGWFRFVELMKETAPQRPESFYRITRAGSAQIGIGSALEPKTLIRIAGPSDAADDDLILEARITAPPLEHECVSRPANGGSLQVLMFTSLLAQHQPEVFGFLPREGAQQAPELWIQSWDPGYRELAVADLQSQTDLNDVAADAGSQLAGHFWTTFPAPLRDHQRFAQLRAFEMSGMRARDLARRLANETVTEWERFRRQR